MSKVKEIISKALSENRSKLLEHEAYKILEEYNIPAPGYGLATTAEEAVELAEKIGYPVVLKIVSPDIVHKSDVGGVILNLNSAEEVKKAFNQIMENVKKHAPNARIAGVLVQEMVPQDVEVIVGSTRDPIFGPVVMFGLGGVFVEVLKDVSFRVVPLTERDAEEMLTEIKAKKILEGYRHIKPRDKKAIINIILGVSKIMEENPEIAELDLNPIMVFPEGQGAKVADVRIIVKK